jgi:hypothetical protein
MRTMVVVIGVLVGAQLAGAAPKVAKPKPLPGGMKVVAKLGRPYVQQGATTVALRDDDVADYEKIAKAELAADGKTIEVTATRCKGELADEVTKVPLAKVQARFDNAAGLVAHGKKQYAVAITKFGSALTKDPETPTYATNLLAAQLLGKKTALASQTLAVQGRKNVIWFAWRLAVDADLAAAKALKGAQDFIAATPGTATLAKLGDHDLATTSLGGGMAALRTLSVGSPGTTEVDVVSMTTGRLLARLPLVTLEDACDESADSPCDDAAKARIAERVKLIDTLFASLGFQITPNAFVDVRNGDPVSKDGISVDLSDDSLIASRGGAERTLTLEGQPWAIAYTPKALVVKLNRRNLYGCNDGSSRFEGVALALP